MKPNTIILCENISTVEEDNQSGVHWEVSWVMWSLYQRVYVCEETTVY